MANRTYYVSDPTFLPFVKEKSASFEYFNGFSIAQKQKSILSFHNSIQMSYPYMKILEISSKSSNLLGVKLSAFNLCLFDQSLQKLVPIENVFQSSKVFKHGGPYRDLLLKTSREAKQDPRIRDSGCLIKFNYNGTDWDLIPKTAFYDWIYIQALYNHQDLAAQILGYDAFTDIEFNAKRSINCQARSAAMYVGLAKSNNLEIALQSRQRFLNFYTSENGLEQYLV